MIDNWNLIYPLLNFDSEDDFYYAVVLKRKKEHPEIGNNSYQVKSYFIKNLEDYEKNRDEMIKMAQMFNARVYINLNRRSFEKIAFQTLRKVVDQIMNKGYKDVKKAYTSTCGSFNNEPVKRWIIDIDDKEYDSTTLVQQINELRPISDKLVATIPTKNGYHLIVNPFDVQEANMKITAFRQGLFDIQKDNPSILFIP